MQRLRHVSILTSVETNASPEEGQVCAVLYWPVQQLGELAYRKRVSQA